MSHKKNPGWLGYIRDYTAQLYGDYNQHLEGSMSTGFFSWLRWIFLGAFILRHLGVQVSWLS